MCAAAPGRSLRGEPLGPPAPPSPGGSPGGGPRGGPGGGPRRGPSASSPRGGPACSGLGMVPMGGGPLGGGGMLGGLVALPPAAAAAAALCCARVRCARSLARIMGPSILAMSATCAPGATELSRAESLSSSSSPVKARSRAPRACGEVAVGGAGEGAMGMAWGEGPPVRGAGEARGEACRLAGWAGWGTSDASVP
jgi:hypothetical protein